MVYNSSGENHVATTQRLLWHCFRMLLLPEQDRQKDRNSLLYVQTNSTALESDNRLCLLELGRCAGFCEHLSVTEKRAYTGIYKSGSKIPFNYLCVDINTILIQLQISA